MQGQWDSRLSCRDSEALQQSTQVKQSMRKSKYIQQLAIRCQQAAEVRARQNIEFAKIGLKSQPITEEALIYYAQQGALEAFDFMFKIGAIVDKP